AQDLAQRAGALAIRAALRGVPRCDPGRDRRYAAARPRRALLDLRHRRAQARAIRPGAARASATRITSMKIEWDVPIRVDDGLVLRADVFRPDAEGRTPAILSYGPYGKGLAFQDGYKTAWEIMARE